MRNHLSWLFLFLFGIVLIGCQDDINVNKPVNSNSILSKSPLLLGKLGDRVWNDLNKNGRQDDGEPGIEGFPVGLLNTGTNSFQVTHTDSNGNYYFDNLPAGSYKLRFHADVPGVWTFANPNVGDDDKDSDVNPADSNTILIDLSDGEEDLTWDAGYFKTPTLLGKLGDRVWNDLNKNGRQDNEEPGIEGFPVGLLNTETNSFQVTHTDANGNYAFDNLPAGKYRIKFHADIAGVWNFTKSNVGNDKRDSDVNPADSFTVVIDLSAGEEDLTWDAGYVKIPTQLGGKVWKDKNKNGIQERGEHGMNKVKVSLYDCNGNVLKWSTTNHNGSYLFSNLTPGDYKLKFHAPFGYAFTINDQGSDDTLDSDAAPETGFTTCITLGAGQRDLKWDTGFYRVGHGGDHNGDDD